MYAASKQRLFSIVAVLIIVVTTLLSATPAMAKYKTTAEYTVKKGETMTSIAKKFGLTIDQIMLVNPDLTNPNNLYTGQVIILPAGRSEGLSGVKEGRIYVWQREAHGGRVELDEHLYLVKSGDSLTRIAKAYGVTLERLLEVNPQIEDQNKLWRGELVRIPDGRAEKVPPFYSTPKTPSK